jgi:hypothetical protein
VSLSPTLNANFFASDWMRELEESLNWISLILTAGMAYTYHYSNEVATIASNLL